MGFLSRLWKDEEAVMRLIALGIVRRFLKENPRFKDPLFHAINNTIMSVDIGTNPKSVVDIVKENLKKITLATEELELLSMLVDSVYREFGVYAIKQNKPDVEFGKFMMLLKSIMEITREP